MDTLTLAFIFLAAGLSICLAAVAQSVLRKDSASWLGTATVGMVLTVIGVAGLVVQP